MTQQSLITRLKTVEKALVAGMASMAAIDFLPLEEFNKADVALSDLRELIKEAEGQEPVRYAATNPMGVITGVSIDSGNGYTKPLYTAIGEKP